MPDPIILVIAFKRHSVLLFYKVLLISLFLYYLIINVEIFNQYCVKLFGPLILQVETYFLLIWQIFLRIFCLISFLCN